MVERSSGVGDEADRLHERDRIAARRDAQLCDIWRWLGVLTVFRETKRRSLISPDEGRVAASGNTRGSAPSARTLRACLLSETPASNEAGLAWEVDQLASVLADLADLPQRGERSGPIGERNVSLASSSRACTRTIGRHPPPWDETACRSHVGSDDMPGATRENRRA
jgi:hypothetical protein